MNDRSGPYLTVRPGRSATGRSVTAPLLTVLTAVGLALAGCGNGADDTATETTSGAGTGATASTEPPTNDTVGDETSTSTTTSDDGAGSSTTASDTTQVARSAPAAETCSAQSLADPTISNGQSWSDLAAQIQAAALACDYDRLASLASPTIVYSFGGSGDFARFLQEAEQAGDDPTRTLVLLLGADPAERPDPEQVVWPAFFACEPECGMDETEARRLGYTDDDIAGFRQFGGYIGYRAIFEPDPSGGYTWTVFVTGD